MRLFDAVAVLDEQEILRSFRWEDEELEKNCSYAWLAGLGQPFPALFDNFEPDKAFGTVSYNGESFDFLRWDSGSGQIHYFLKKHSDHQFLCEAALEKILDGVQIYDKDACLVFINENSRKISKIPANISVRGRHLLDLYNLDKTVSTTLTCLETAAPVVNRFDVFETTTGARVISTNTAYPIFKKRELVGAMVFEQDLSVIKSQIDHLEKIRTIMLDKAEATSVAKFSGYTFNNIIGRHPKLLKAVNLAKRVAEQNLSVLLVGETGTGKEIFAQSIHKASPRKDKNFVAINCSAVPDSLIECVFFGTQKGAFTGSTDSAGLLEEANGGTLFLDELNSMSLSMQSKLLRVIQEGTFRRVGGRQNIKTDIRFISSCNEQPSVLLANNIMRRDLFYRLSAVTIDLPALREHPEDIDELMECYIAVKSYQYVKPVEGVSPSVSLLLKRYHWPGNVRELYHVLDFALNVVEDSTIDVNHLPKYLQNIHEDMQPPMPEFSRPGEEPDWLSKDLQYIMDAYESRVLRAVLEHYGGNISRTADALGIRRQSLQYRIKKYGIVL
ncbi:MAG TPA: sigma 54-interacting transcriptional regulator [Selenomonadales bacterium]|nr:sigma 54-interacting transcriptional regulator [Selenomonadales bacterium]